MKDKGLDKGLIREFNTSDRDKRGWSKGFFGFRKMFWDYLNKLNVSFTDACCPEASTAVPNAVIFTTAQNDIAAGTGGAISVANYLTTINTDAGGDAFTLADGTLKGQLKKILLVVDGGGNAVVTPANLAAGTTITFGDATDYVVLVWGGTEWFVIENSGATVA